MKADGEVNGKQDESDSATGEQPEPAAESSTPLAQDSSVEDGKEEKPEGSRHQEKQEERQPDAPTGTAENREAATVAAVGGDGEDSETAPLQPAALNSASIESDTGAAAQGSGEKLSGHLHDNHLNPHLSHGLCHPRLVSRASTVDPYACHSHVHCLPHNSPWSLLHLSSSIAWSAQSEC